jgi:hypothetical protein
VRGHNQMVLGTAAYLAPEQALGQSAEERHRKLN